MQLNDDQRSILLNLTRQTITAELGSSPVEKMDQTDPILGQPAGCFVTLHGSEKHQLRGCIGRLDTNLPLGQAIVEAARGVLEDPRFVDDPVTSAELPRLEVELTIILPLRPANGPLDFDPPTEGIYLTIGHRAGCFLPQVAQDTGWTGEQLLDRLCTEKMGLPASAWRDHPDAKLSKFTTILVGPEPFEPTQARPNVAASVDATSHASS